MALRVLSGSLRKDGGCGDECWCGARVVVVRTHLRSFAGVVLVVAGGVLAGCTSGESAVSPTMSFPTVLLTAPTQTRTVPVPTTSTVTPSPTPSLYDQAVEVYNRYHEQDVKLLLAGGAETLPPEMVELLTDGALDMATAGYAAIKAEGYHLVGDPRFQVIWVRPYAGDLLEGTVVALETCEELTGARWQSGDGTHIDQWDHYLKTYRHFFRYDDQDRLVMFGTSGEAVESCLA